MKNWERFGIGIMSLWFLFAVHQGVNALVRAHNWQPMTISDWGTWIGSIGTVGALIGTIWLATAETRRRDREAQDLATLAAAAILLKTARVTGAIKSLINTLGSELPPGREADAYKICFNTLSMAERWTINDLVPLVPLSNHVAAKLAFVDQILITVAMSLKGACEDKVQVNAAFDGELVKQLRIANAALATSVAECRKLANQLIINVDS
jgi:hypothetical protein